MDEEKKTEPTEAIVEQAPRTATETGISVEQAEQLARAAADKDELDSAAEAAARWS